ncbi:hypothetical protein MPSEU_000570800 [Mayamaea pseudoterrestris]|nr:hypothetical protein MPSEU_000570800 [Mayamaea pseudoterrestris]
MWWRKEDTTQTSESAAAVPGSSSKRSAVSMLLSNSRSAQMRKQLIQKPNAAVAALTTDTQAEEPVMHVSETGSGIEVSFSDDLISLPEQLADATSPAKQNPDKRNKIVAAGIVNPGRGRQQRLEQEGVVSLQSQLWHCQAVHQAQFSYSTPTTTTTTTASINTAYTGIASLRTEANMEHVPDYFTSREHRVGLFGSETQQSSFKFDDVLFLLRSHEIIDEATCVDEELSRLASEIDALLQDRADLQAKTRALRLVGVHDEDADAQMQQPTTPATPTLFDVYRLLAHSSSNLSHTERTRLQTLRGLHLTLSLHNQLARDAFLSKCGATSSVFKQNKKKYQNIVEISPDNCRDGGAGATIQHVSLLKSSLTDVASFFVSKDKGKAFSFGHLPEKLFDRLKKAGHDPSDILYLATGPLGTYYAEYRSGESWWGSLSEDEQFHAICSNPAWNIHRVAFGPLFAIYDKMGGKRYFTSWIILGRDGRAAWRNIPTRLQHLLEHRLANAPACCEVTLGCGGAYFVRFLDGKTDYCLPAAAAGACRTLEMRGASIMSITLHPELAHDFVIRSNG